MSGWERTSTKPSSLSRSKRNNLEVGMPSSNQIPRPMSTWKESLEISKERVLSCKTRKEMKWRPFKSIFRRRRTQPTRPSKTLPQKILWRSKPKTASRECPMTLSTSWRNQLAVQRSKRREKSIWNTTKCCPLWDSARTRKQESNWTKLGTPDAWATKLTCRHYWTNDTNLRRSWTNNHTLNTSWVTGWSRTPKCCKISTKN